MTVKEVERILQKRITEMENTIKEAKQIIEDLVGEDPCEFDHHGYCQAHGWMDESECPHARAKKFMKMMEEGK